MGGIRFSTFAGVVQRASRVIPEGPKLNFQLTRMKLKHGASSSFESFRGFSWPGKRRDMFFVQKVRCEFPKIRFGLLPICLVR